MARWFGIHGLAVAAAIFPLTSPAQNLLPGMGIGGSVKLLQTDSSVLDIEDTKKDLPCVATPVKPVLGFDLRFHTGYEVSVPLRELTDDSGNLTIVFKVIPDNDKDDPVYFSQRYTVPEIDDDARGDAYLGGGFDVGEGSYHISWMMRDRMERVCSSSWDVTASLPSKDQTIKLTMKPESIGASESEFFKAEPPVTRIDGDPLKVKVLINFAPQRAGASAMQPVDTSALVSILRNISREPRITKFSIVAFSMNDQRVLYRKDDADSIDFPELGRAVASMKLGTVDYKKLADKRSEADFLTKLIQDELSSNNSDAVIFAGPKVMLDDPPSPDAFKDLASGTQVPVFYMNYNLMPQQNPWRDSIGTVVKKMRGNEYTISRPRDLWSSWTDIMGRVGKVKLMATNPASSK
jgi:hypothetical protein